MAAARSTLLEGLEDISEEEQLRRVLEMSEREAGAGEADTVNPGTGGSFESWVNTPAAERLRAAQDSLEQRGEAGEIYYSDNEAEEELRRVNGAMTEEEATKLAIEASEKESGRPSSVENIDKDLERAIKLSMCNVYSTVEGARMRHNSVADPEPHPQGASAIVTSTDHDLQRSRPHTSGSTGRKTKSRSVSPAETSLPRRQRHRSSTQPAYIGSDTAAMQPLNIPTHKTPSPPGPGGASFPALPMSEEQQLKMALKQSAEETVMSEADQIKLALRLSQTDGEDDQLNLALKLSQRSEGLGGSVPIHRQDPLGGSSSPVSQPPPSLEPPNVQLQMRPPGPSSGSGDTRHLGARSRVPHPRSKPQRHIRDVSSSSSSSSSNPGTLERHSPPSSTDTSQDNLRMIVLDGSNICLHYGKGDDFVTEALTTVYQWFAPRGYDVVMILPQSRKSKLMGAKRWAEVEKLNDFEKANILYYSPSKKTDERSWDCYDDRYIIEFAARKKAIVVSNDYYREILKENNPEFKEQIRDRVLPFTFVRDIFMPPEDPKGRNGPRLNEFLRF